MRKLKKAQTGNQVESDAMAQQKANATQAVMQTQKTFGEDINWQHVLASQTGFGLAKGLSNMLPNSYQNAILRWNQQQTTPTSYLPYTSNNSTQDMYGINEFQDGGEVGEDDFLKFMFQDDPRTQDTPREEKPVVNRGVDEPETWSEADEMGVFNSLNFQRTIPKRTRFAESEGTATQLDPNVIAAAQELQAKFPSLKITSAIRNWGDKDAHPKGRAIDLAGDGLDEAYNYYKNTIVPKYGFNAALPENHGTGKHIHVGYYQQGGTNYINTNQAQAKAPVYQTQQEVDAANAFAVEFSKRGNYLDPTNAYVARKVGDPVVQFKDINTGQPYNGQYSQMPKSMIKSLPDWVTKLEWDKQWNMPYYLDGNDINYVDKHWYNSPKFTKPPTLDANGNIASLKKGGINTSGFLDGTPTSENDYNIIPGGNITMKGVSQPILATPYKGNKALTPVVMLPGEQYNFDADFVHEEKFAEGGIHIKKSNRGKFTAAAKRAGMSVQEYAQHVLNDPNASSTMKKRANFARNASKWNHEDGGQVFKQGGTYELSDQEIQSLLDQGYELDFE